MNVFLCGQKQFGASVLEAIAKKYKVLGVSSPAFASHLATDGSQIFDRVRATAERLRIPWQPEVRADSLPSGTDIIVAAHSHDFIGRKTRARAKFGAIGYHPSLLPLHRGRDAVRWAIHGGDRVAGGSVYWLTDTIDAGPIAAQQHVFVRPGETVGEPLAGAACPAWSSPAPEDAGRPGPRPRGQGSAGRELRHLGAVVR